MAVRLWLRDHPSIGPYVCMVILLMVGYIAFGQLVEERSTERRRVDIQTCLAGQSAVEAVDRLERSIEGILRPIIENPSVDPRVVAFRERTTRELAAARTAIDHARQDCSQLPQP